MEALIANSKELVGRTNIDLVRYIHDRIEWDARLVALVGARGVGKTTMLLQHIKMHDNLDEVLFVPADNLYFTNHTLLDLATMFYRRGGRKLYIDEIHRYSNWSQEIKNIYDMLPDLHVVYTGSSILDLEKGGADLSRRRLQYTMYGLSFREYIKLAYGIDVRVHSFDEILNSKIDFPYDKYRPLKLFDEYLKVGYYPFFADKGYHERLSNMLMQTLEVDIPNFAGMSVGVTGKLRSLLYIIAQSVPFKPNYSKIARDLEMSRNDLKDWFFYLEKSGMIGLLRSGKLGDSALAKPEKVFLDNTNLAYAICEIRPDIGNLRETVFYSMSKVKHNVKASEVSDFMIDGYTFEVGGKKKNKRQIFDVPDSFVVKDDIEYGSKGVIPLWAFGLEY